jgi:hypothetical protein
MQQEVIDSIVEIKFKSTNKKFLLITPKNWNELTNEILQLNKI